MANSPNAEATPIVYWNLVTNFNPSVMPGATSIAMPRAGALSVVYSYQNDRPAKRIYVMVSGVQKPINPGENSFVVSAGDTLVWQLFESDSDSIQIGFQLT